jgi:hypothetical protein
VKPGFPQGRVVKIQNQNLISKRYEHTTPKGLTNKNVRSEDLTSEIDKRLLGRRPTLTEFE